MLSLWLTFAPEDERNLAGVITDLARRYGAPVFRPHITAAGSLPIGDKALERRLSDIFSGVADFPVYSAGVGHTAEYWRTVFVKIRRERELARLLTRLRLLPELAGERRPPPHISLIYHRLSPAQRAELAAEISPAARYLVTGAALVDTSGVSEDWCILRRYRFGERRTITDQSV